MRTAIALLGLLLAATLASGEDIRVRLTGKAAYTDEPFGVMVEIGEVDETITDLALTVPDGFTASRPIRRGQRSTTMNGVTRSWVEFAFRVEPPGDANGEYAIGPMVVTYESGKTERVPVGSIRLGPRPAGDVLFRVSAEPPTGPIALPFTVTYRVLYSGELAEGRDAFGDSRTPLGLTGFDLAILSRADLRVESVEPASGSRPIRLGRDRVAFFRTGHAEEDGKLYRMLQCSFRVTPLVAEDIDLSGRVGLALHDGTERRRDVFGRLREVAKTREARASTGDAVYRVAPLPERGRPAGFNGAVGRFTIEAVPAEREVNAFDPIEVTVTVRGRGVLERVALPRWSEFPGIAREFDLDADVDPGEVEGEAKVFRVTFRARSSAVTALPALPFPHYDPWRGDYVTVLSKPVPLTVRDVKTVRPEDAVGGASGPAAAAETPTRRLGIGANFATLDESGTLAGRPPLFSLGFILLLGLPPLAGAAWLVIARRRARPRDVPAGTPLSRALGALARADDADAAAEAFSGYFRDRLELSGGELTTREIERALVARVVPPETTERVVAAQDALVACRFAGGDAPVGLEDLLREVDRCLA